MARLVYLIITSLDGHIEDPDGNFDWGEPDAEQFGFITDIMRSFGTHLLGRRMYQTMAVWETDPSLADHSPAMREFAEIWRAADKVVFSTTLDAPVTSRTRIEQRFDPERVRALTASANGDVSIAGPELASHAIRAGLVDEVQLFVTPIVTGGGKSCLPPGVRLRLELADERRFENGAVYLRYLNRTHDDPPDAA